MSAVSDTTGLQARCVLGNKIVAEALERWGGHLMRFGMLLMALVVGVAGCHAPMHNGLPNGMSATQALLEQGPGVGGPGPGVNPASAIPARVGPRSRRNVLTGNEMRSSSYGDDPATQAPWDRRFPPRKPAKGGIS